MLKIQQLVLTVAAELPRQKGKEPEIHGCPHAFYINEKMYYEDIDLTQEQFTRCCRTDFHLNIFNRWSPPTQAGTSGIICWLYDEIVLYSWPSMLSGSCETAKVLARE